MKEILEIDQIIEAIKQYQSQKAHMLVMGMEVDYIDVEYDRKTDEVVATVVMREREELAPEHSGAGPDSDSDIDLDFESYDDMVEEKVKGGFVEQPVIRSDDQDAPDEESEFVPVYDLEI